MNTTRIDELIAKRGVHPNLSIAEWQEFIGLVVARLGTGGCYSFCLYPYSHLPAKGYFAGFPERIIDRLQYLNMLELVVIDEEVRSLLTSFLEEHCCPWEVTTQYDPESDIDEPIGLRVFGYSEPGNESSRPRK